jgi:hypothetical protein
MRYTVNEFVLNFAPLYPKEKDEIATDDKNVALQNMANLVIDTNNSEWQESCVIPRTNRAVWI